jgi:single-strand DNA-binding protein
MGSVNKVILVGRLGDDPTVRYTAAGQAVANFSLATDETYKDRNGEKQKKTEWHKVVVWGKVAEEFVGKYLKKGMLVFVEGKLQSRTWDDREGNKKYVTEVNVANIVNLESKPTGTGNANSRPAQRANSRPVPQEPIEDVPTGEINDEDIPF